MYFCTLRDSNKETKMKPQNYEIKNLKIEKQFKQLKKDKPGNFERRLNLSWSNWGFGLESLEDSVKRLSSAGLEYIELHGSV